MKNICEFIEEYDNKITEDLDLILESELIEEGFFGKLKAAWNALKDAIKNSPSWKAYQEKQERYAQVDKEVEEKYKQLHDKIPEIKEIIKQQNNNKEVKPEKVKRAREAKKDICLELIEMVNRLNKIQQDYKLHLDDAKEIGINNVNDARKYIDNYDKNTNNSDSSSSNNQKPKQLPKQLPNASDTKNDNKPSGDSSETLDKGNDTKSEASDTLGTGDSNTSKETPKV